ncbi:MAG: hypothetical protein Ct9H90mP4_06250 [Gammaproteobacteria bacterium]|nr:MAG: hypothetical protein Ct9H90mP4_06250 [Gammaproteobacteria bacterium]
MFHFYRYRNFRFRYKFSQIIQVGSVVTDESLVVENEHQFVL